VNLRRLAVVLPAYNEEGAIEATVTDVLAKLPALVPDFVVVPVDDGSQDATGAILDRLAAAEGARVVPVHNTTNLGYGGSLCAGFDRSLELGASHVFFMDADGQFDIADLAGLLPRLADRDAVLGYRAERSDTALRKLNAFAWQMLVWILYGVRVRDLACAFKVLPATFLASNRMVSAGAMISTEILVRMRHAGLSYAEVAVRHLPRTTGTATGARPSVILKAFAELFRLHAVLDSAPTPATNAEVGDHEQ
jgi:hypothetical protein